MLTNCTVYIKGVRYRGQLGYLSLMGVGVTFDRMTATEIGIDIKLSFSQYTIEFPVSVVVPDSNVSHVTRVYVGEDGEITSKDIAVALVKWMNTVDGRHSNRFEIYMRGHEILAAALMMESDGLNWNSRVVELDQTTLRLPPEEPEIEPKWIVFKRNVVYSGGVEWVMQSAYSPDNDTLYIRSFSRVGDDRLTEGDNV